MNRKENRLDDCIFILHSILSCWCNIVDFINIKILLWRKEDSEEDGEGRGGRWGGEEDGEGRKNRDCPLGLHISDIAMLTFLSSLSTVITSIY